uniref:Uncharacterized protein n=1 Tax=Peronospora matthiolae TaxID=2874970 RepID=A0AAV1T006_9STRA
MLQEYHISPTQLNFWQLQPRGLRHPITTRNTLPLRADGSLLAELGTSDSVNIPGGLCPATHEDSIADATHPPITTSQCTTLAICGLAGVSALLLTENSLDTRNQSFTARKRVFSHSSTAIDDEGQTDHNS